MVSPTIIPSLTLTIPFLFFNPRDAGGKYIEKTQNPFIVGYLKRGRPLVEELYNYFFTTHDPVNIVV